MYNNGELQLFQTNKYIYKYIDVFFSFLFLFSYFFFKIYNSSLDFL